MSSNLAGWKIPELWRFVAGKIAQSLVYVFFLASAFAVDEVLKLGAKKWPRYHVDPKHVPNRLGPVFRATFCPLVESYRFRPEMACPTHCVGVDGPLATLAPSPGSEVQTHRLASRKGRISEGRQAQVPWLSNLGPKTVYSKRRYSLIQLFSYAGHPVTSDLTFSVGSLPEHFQNVLHLCQLSSTSEVTVLDFRVWKKGAFFYPHSTPREISYFSNLDFPAFCRGMPSAAGLHELELCWAVWHFGEVSHENLYFVGFKGSPGKCQ